MDEHMQALADRFNAAADRLEKAGKIKTRWVPGARGVWSRVEMTCNPDIPRVTKPGAWIKIPGACLDFTDPLTVLAVLLLVREASGDPCASVEFDHDVGAWFAGWTSSDGAWFAGWTNSDGFADEAHPAQTEIEALITALEDLAEETP